MNTTEEILPADIFEKCKEFPLADLFLIFGSDPDYLSKFII